jgi:hypothetical protein
MITGGMTTGRNIRERRDESKGKEEWTNRGDMTTAKHIGSGGTVPCIPTIKAIQTVLSAPLNEKLKKKQRQKCGQLHTPAAIHQGRYHGVRWI